MFIAEDPRKALLGVVIVAGTEQTVTITKT